MQHTALNEVIPIHETFQQTVQGEGYWAGTPVDFIRLSGCPVGCPWCDTGYSTVNKTAPKGELRSFGQLLGELRSKRVVISGGEPFIQPQLPALVDTLCKAGFLVNIETSGCHWRELPDTVWITLSPKQHVNPKFPVAPEFWKRADELKLVISDGSEIEFYQEITNFTKPVFLQPEWENPQSLQIALKALRSHQDFRLSLQTHKLIGVQ